MDQYFKKDNQGRILFFPWQDMGAGYLLPNEAKRQEIARFFKRYVLIGFLLFLGASVAVPGMAGSLGGTLLSLLWYAVGTRSLVRGLEVAQESPGFRQYCATQAAISSFSLLSVCFIFCLLGAWGAEWILSKGHVFTGVVGMVVFGVLVNICGYMITIKARKA